MVTLQTQVSHRVTLLSSLLLISVGLLFAYEEQEETQKINSTFKDLIPGSSFVKENVNVRSKRNIIQLASNTARRTKFSILKLANYGNWCGKGGDRKGDGSVVDGCDLCCKIHDQCYRRKRTATEGCNPVTVTYKSRYNEKEDMEICESDENKCAQGICHCDMNFINCMRKEPCSPLQVYNSVSYLWWLGL